MKLLYTCLVFCTLLIALISGRTILEEALERQPSEGVLSPVVQKQEPGHRERRQAGPQRGYKDICRVVHTNGFSNPGNVPRCPY